MRQPRFFRLVAPIPLKIRENLAGVRAGVAMVKLRRQNDPTSEALPILRVGDKPQV
jgi:hypothetical protein